MFMEMMMMMIIRMMVWFRLWWFRKAGFVVLCWLYDYYFLKVSRRGFGVWRGEKLLWLHGAILNCNSLFHFWIHTDTSKTSSSSTNRKLVLKTWVKMLPKHSYKSFYSSLPKVGTIKKKKHTWSNTLKHISKGDVIGLETFCAIRETRIFSSSSPMFP